MTPTGILSTPWDEKIFGIPTYEITEISDETINFSKQNAGHYTIKVDPLVSNDLPAQGFYYCDTLLKPVCTSNDFTPLQLEGSTIIENLSLDDVLSIGHQSYKHGRFHRDPNLSSADADRRYDNWLRQLHTDGHIIGMEYKGEMAAYVAVDGGAILLYAISKKFRGKGLGKYCMAAGCSAAINKGFTELTSSVSASNLAIINLFTSLGFRLRGSLDIYHRVTN
jgi:ribosomal protein S18 acetylase RimI-like enzyme